MSETSTELTESLKGIAYLIKDRGYDFAHYEILRAVRGLQEARAENERLSARAARLTKIILAFIACAEREAIPQGLCDDAREALQE